MPGIDYSRSPSAMHLRPSAPVSSALQFGRQSCQRPWRGITVPSPESQFDAEITPVRVRLPAVTDELCTLCSAAANPCTYHVYFLCLTTVSTITALATAAQQDWHRHFRSTLHCRKLCTCARQPDSCWPRHMTLRWGPCVVCGITHAVQTVWQRV